MGPLVGLGFVLLGGEGMALCTPRVTPLHAPQNIRLRPGGKLSFFSVKISGGTSLQSEGTNACVVGYGLG